MDNEISNGMNFGVSLAILTITLLVVATLCNLTRKGYIERQDNLAYQKELEANLVWDKLGTYSIHDTIVNSDITVTHIDNFLLWLNFYGESYKWCIAIQDYNDPTKYDCWYNNSEILKGNGRGKIAQTLFTCNPEATNNNILSIENVNVVYQPIIDTSVDILERQADILNNLGETSELVQVVVWERREHFDSFGASEKDRGLTNIIGDYELPKHSIILFIINQPKGV